MKAALDTSLPDGAARVDIRLASGESLEETVMAARGSLADPLSDADIEAKLRDCLRLGGTDWDGESVISAVWRLDGLTDMSGLMRAPRGNGAFSSEKGTGSREENALEQETTASVPIRSERRL